VRIEVQTSGGFAGIRRAPEVVDTGELEGDEARALEALARQVIGEPGASGAGSPDRFQYDVTVDGQHVRLHEDGLSDAARQLISRVREMSRGAA
jgi:hypothetical protein